MDRDGLTRATIGHVNGNMIIDTHTHLYDPFRDGGTPWPDPDDKVLYQTTRLDRCKAQAVPAGVDGTIVVVRFDGGPSFYRFSKNGRAVYLTPAKGDEAATAVEDPERLHLIGRVVALYRRLDDASILVSTTAH